MKCLIVFLMMTYQFIDCRFLGSGDSDNTLDNRIVKQKIDTCIQKQCIYSDDDLMAVCKGFNECVNSACRSELQLDNYSSYLKCNQNCLTPFIQTASESDKELITGFYSCRLQCVQQEIKEKQLQNQSEEEQNNIDDMRIQAIFASISIFVALAIGIALYIWCSIYYRRRQELIIVPGQINIQIDQQGGMSNSNNNQDILQSRITDPDKIFVVEGSAILHNNQKIIPKFGFNIPQGVMVGKQLPNPNEKQLNQSAAPINQANADTSILDFNQSATYNNISLLEQGIDLSMINPSDNRSQLNLNQPQNINNQQNDLQPDTIADNINNISQQINTISAIRTDQIQPNNLDINQLILNGDRSPYLIADRSPYLTGDKSPYILRSNKMIPIHDIYIQNVNKDKETQDKTKIDDSLYKDSAISYPTLNTESNHPQIQILKDFLLPPSSPSMNTNNNFEKTNERRKSNKLLGADLMKKSSKKSSKNSSKRPSGSIIANLENKASANKQVSPFTVFFPSPQEIKNKSEEEDESDYEYYYETESSGDSSEDEKNPQANSNQPHIKRKSGYKSEEIGKSLTCIEIPAGNTEDLHISEDDKKAAKKDGNNNNTSIGSNKFNGSTDDTIIQACSTSQNFGQQGEFTLRCYSAEKGKEQFLDITDRFNESQKIMINPKRNLIITHENASTGTESTSQNFNQSQSLSPDISYSTVKTQVQALTLKACDEDMTVMQTEERKKSSSIDISGANSLNKELQQKDSQSLEAQI